MDFSWSAAQRELYQRMRALGEEAAAAPADRRMGMLAQAGALGLALDPAYGGGGVDLVTTAHAYEGLGSTLGDGGVLLAAGAHLFGVALAIQKAGSDAQRRQWLPELAAGTRIATVAATERGAGSDVAQVEAEVASAAGGWLARGEKAYVTYADRAGLFLFVGRAAGQRGLTVALVPLEVGGVRAGPLLDTVGLAGARLAPVAFADCPLDAGAVLGRPGAGMAVFQIAMTYERALVLAFRLGAMQRQLDEAVAFVKRRKLGQTPLGSHQAVSHRLARMKQRLEAARLSTYRAAWLLDRGERAQVEAALAKWQLAEAAVDSALDAVQLRGGAGYLAASGQADALLDAIGGGIHSGTGDVLAGIVARWLGL